MPLTKAITVPAIDPSYRVLRTLLQLWFRVFFRKIRLLEEGFPTSGATILLINHPAGFLDALILVAAFERQLHCVLERRLIKGPLRGFIARGLGVIDYTPDERGRRAAMESCYQLLSREAAVVLFEELADRTDLAPSSFAVRVSDLALEAESQLGPVTIFPVHLLLPVAPSKSTELMIYVDAPLIPRQYIGHESQASQRAEALAIALEKACRDNAFRLQPENFEQFLSEVEGMLRRDLEEDWSTRPHWKQKIEGFGLSRLVQTAAEQMNRLHPGRLVALWEMLDSYREGRRAASLRQFETEAADWLKSPFLRAITWLEVLLGAPAAAYGLLNHIPALLVLAAARLLKRSGMRSVAVEWTARGLILLAFYVVQIAMCAHFLGRAAAGYYAVSLPVSAVYLWRYTHMARRRGRLAYFHAMVPTQAARLRYLRKRLLTELESARDKFGVIRSW